MNKIETIVRAVLTHNQKILLVKKKTKTFYFLPGGHIKFGESAKRALRRELKEETGMDVVIGKYLGAVEHTWKTKGKRHAEINLIFKAQFKNRLSIIKSLEPRLFFLWQDISKLSHTKLQPYCLRKFLPCWIAGRAIEQWASTF